MLNTQNVEVICRMTTEQCVYICTPQCQNQSCQGLFLDISNYSHFDLRMSSLNSVYLVNCHRRLSFEKLDSVIFYLFIFPCFALALGSIVNRSVQYSAHCFVKQLPNLALCNSDSTVQHQCVSSCSNKRLKKRKRNPCFMRPRFHQVFDWI